MKVITRYAIPALLIVWGLFLLPEFPSAFRLVNRSDLPGVYISLAMLPLLIPAGIGAIASPKWGGTALAIVGALGVLGLLLQPSFYHAPVYIGLGPTMYLIALIDGLVLLRMFKRRPVTVFEER